MPTVTFFARGDSGLASNPSVNATNTNQVPVTEITFTSGTSGDLVLEHNGGLADPDTQAIIGGVTYDVTLIFHGTLKPTNKLKNVNGQDLRGEEVIIVEIDGQRYFFLPKAGASEATMDDFPNGAHDVDNLDDTSSFLICFTHGTLIRTPDGEVPVQSLRAGDIVSVEGGGSAPILWVADSFIPATRLAHDPTKRPIRIAAGALGPGHPYRDLLVSPQHRVVWRSWLNEMLFAVDTVLVPAKMLVPRYAETAVPAGGIRYHHLLFNRHEMVYSNGIPTESFQPAAASLGELAVRTRKSYEASLSDGLKGHLSRRDDKYYSLKSYEAALLAETPPLAESGPMADMCAA